MVFTLTMLKTVTDGTAQVTVAVLVRVNFFNARNAKEQVN